MADMSRKSNALDLHIPAPRARPGDKPDFSGWSFPEPGATPRPDIDEAAVEMRDYAYGLIRVLDMDGNALGPWTPSIAPEELRRGLRHMLLTRAFDERMHRAQRQGKTSFYMQSLGEEAIAEVHVVLEIEAHEEADGAHGAAPSVPHARGGSQRRRAKRAPRRYAPPTVRTLLARLVLADDVKAAMRQAKGVHGAMFLGTPLDLIAELERCKQLSAATVVLVGQFASLLLFWAYIIQKFILFTAYALSPLLIGHCKFCPSCSDYCIHAVREWGALRGLWLGLKRLARCHPFGPGGIDPVPQRADRTCGTTHAR